MTIEQILEAIEQMKVTELNELVKAAEEKFGVSASAPVMVAGAAAGAAGHQPCGHAVAGRASGAGGRLRHLYEHDRAGEHRQGRYPVQPDHFYG